MRVEQAEKMVLAQARRRLTHFAKYTRGWILQSLRSEGSDLPALRHLPVPPMYLTASLLIKRFWRLLNCCLIVARLAEESAAADYDAR
jgi:hypothetical protein